MNTLRMRDHGDDNERLVIESLLSETYVAPVDIDEPVDPMYAPVSDDGDAIWTDMQSALMALMLADVSPDAEDLLMKYSESALEELFADEEYAYFNNDPAADQVVLEREEGATPPSSPVLPVIGKSALEIGETVANSSQRLVRSSYTIIVESGPNTAEARALHPSTAYDALALFWDSVEALMREDPIHIYGELITDALSDDVTKNLITGFVQWWDEDLDPDLPNDSEWVPRGVYLYGSGDDLIPDREVFDWYEAATGRLSFTQAGPCMGPLMEVDTITDTISRYRVYVMHRERVTSHFFFDDLESAVVKLIESLGQVMRSDPGCTYWEMITDAWTDSPEGRETIRNMAIGFARGWTDAEERACVNDRTQCPEFDPLVLPRGAYLFVRDEHDEEVAMDAVNQFVSEYKIARVSTIGWEFDPVGYDELPEEMDGNCDECGMTLVDMERQCDDGGNCYCDRCGDSQSVHSCQGCGMSVDSTTQCGDTGCWCADCWDAQSRVGPVASYLVTDNFDVASEYVSLAAATQEFMEQLIQLAQEHPTCTYSIDLPHGDTIFGLRLVQGDDTWTQSDEGELSAGLWIEELHEEVDDRDNPPTEQGIL